MRYKIKMHLYIELICIGFPKLLDFGVGYVGHNTLPSLLVLLILFLSPPLPNPPTKIILLLLQPPMFISNSFVVANTLFSTFRYSLIFSNSNHLSPPSSSFSSRVFFKAITIFWVLRYPPLFLVHIFKAFKIKNWDQRMTPSKRERRSLGTTLP